MPKVSIARHLARPETAGGKGPRRAAGIYGTVITAAIIDTLGDHASTRKLVVAVLVTLLVYWAAEQYAELIGEHTENGHLPRWPTVRASLAASWPMVASSYLPLIILVVVRLAGASASAAATLALVVTVLLLVVYGWTAGRAAGLRGKSLLGATLMAAGLGVVMILLKELLLLHLHLSPWPGDPLDLPGGDSVSQGAPPWGAERGRGSGGALSGHQQSRDHRRPADGGAGDQ